MNTQSKKPRKQRKYLFNAPLHRRQKMMGARLSDDLQEKIGRRTLPLRKGDSVKVMRGDFKGHEGRVEKVDLKAYRVFVEGVNRSKADGTKRFYPISPSNLQILKLEGKDERRKKGTER
jgi:large subunit ribosomal protein L24